CVIAGLFLALGYLARTPKLYQGHIVLEVDFQEPTVVNADGSSSRTRSPYLASLEALRTIEQNLTNRTLLARVIRAEDLSRDGGRALFGERAAGPKENRPSPAPTDSAESRATEPRFASAPTFTPLEEALGGALSGMVRPGIRRGTRLIDLYVLNRDPAMAQRLTEAVGREYIRSTIEQRAAFNRDTLGYLLEEEGRLKKNLPKMMQAQAALQQAQDPAGLAVLAQPAVMKNGLDQIQATEASLEAVVSEQEKAALALNKAAIPYQELARQAETDRALYESVLRQIKETNLTKDVKATAVTVIEHSPLPGVPVSPRPVKAIVLGLLAGLAVGIAFVYVADMLDRSVRTVDQAEAVTGLPVLAAIPETKGDGEKRPGNSQKPVPLRAASYRLVADAPDSQVAEAFRNLRAALSLLGPEADRRIFLFTSALPSEGKSFASANCAIALAQQGQRVLLIDGDLRRPTLHKIFRLSPEQSENGELPGVVDCLVGESGVARAARHVL